VRLIYVFKFEIIAKFNTEAGHEEAKGRRRFERREPGVERVGTGAAGGDTEHAQSCPAVKKCPKVDDVAGDGQYLDGGEITRRWRLDAEETRIQLDEPGAAQ
jgi:hypothetical protein